MTTVLPSATSPWHVIDQAISQQLSQNLPGAVQQGYNRQMGLNSIDQLQSDLASAGGDINKMLPALARAYTLNPNLERSGLGQGFLQQAKVGRAFPEGQGMQQQGLPNQPGQMAPMAAQAGQMDQGQSQQAAPGTVAMPSPFNIMTPQDIDAEAKRYANAVQDPNGYNTRVNQLTAINDAATNQRQALEEAALNADVKPSELPRFMMVNSHLDPRNPSQWAQEGKRNYAKVKANDQKIQNAFIPGIGSALLGRDREKSLNNLRPSLLENKKLGLEQEDRAYLADNYVTPAEIETLYHPVTPKQENSIKKLPKGLFPARTGEELSYFAPNKSSPFVSYEDAIEKDPKAIQVMQDQLSDFFLKNVDNDTSLLGLREKLWKNKDYDWRQIGPALREAEKKGLKLNSEQGREASIMDSQPPVQSLPDIFQDLSRIPAFIRGNR